MLVAIVFLMLVVFQSTVLAQEAGAGGRESESEYRARMQWWNDARFGLFIHWGLYSIPAGEWKGQTDYGEWIRTSAHIPVDEYEKFLSQFNPVKFDPELWVRTAKDAGMNYIVITSKHHDGFCLFDSKYTTFDVMSTPFKRDILKELAAACRKYGMKLCFYHSIMDWHHPDYLPRREWETTRSTEGADFERFVQYLKNELKELLTNYGDIGVLWFDGNWESTWNNDRGRDLYNYVRSLSPNIIINNRVGQPPPSESGVGFRDIGSVGDYGTPEQEVPATGLPGQYWETCMTMNDHWGYNSHDIHWKSSRELIQTLADIASKGGNFLLNVGPTAEGVFPQASIDRLRDIGSWMKVNGEAIYGTSASPFSAVGWGRVTQKNMPDGTRLYLHIFDWPRDGNLDLHGILNEPTRTFLLADGKRIPLEISRNEDALRIHLLAVVPDSIDAVVALDIASPPNVVMPPVITSAYDIFIDSSNVLIGTDRKDVDVRYTLDGTTPTVHSAKYTSPIMIRATQRITARCFINDLAVSEPSMRTISKVDPNPPAAVGAVEPGLQFKFYSGTWDSLPDFDALAPAKEGIVPVPNLAPADKPEFFGLRFDGLIRIDGTAIYDFTLGSDDGSRLTVDGSIVVDDNGLHGMVEKHGVRALAEGFHSIRLEYFQKTGDKDLTLKYKTAASGEVPVTANMFVHNMRAQ